MTKGTSMDTVWFSNGRYKVVNNNAQQQNPVQDTVPNPSTNPGKSKTLTWVEKKQIKEDMGADLGSVATIEMKNGKIVCKLPTDFIGGKIVDHEFILEDGKLLDTKDNNKPYTKDEILKKVNSAKAYADFKVNAAQHGATGQCDAEQFNDDLSDWTSDNIEDIEKTLNGLDKDNIIPFLEDYYEATGYNGLHGAWQNGLLMRTDHEIDGYRISMASRRNYIKALLDVASDLGFEDCKEYREIEKIYDRYDPQNGRYKDKEDMTGARNKSAEYPLLRTIGNAAGGAVVGALAGACIGACAGGIGAVPGAISGGIYGAVAGLTGQAVILVAEIGPYAPKDCEKLDRAMYRLYQKIVEKLGTSEGQTSYIQPKRTMGTYEA